MAELLAQKAWLKNIFFEFNCSVKQHVSRTAISAKWAPTSSCIQMAKVETAFLKPLEMTYLVWFRYIHDLSHLELL